jgi:hypothetical protein
MGGDGDEKGGPCVPGLSTFGDQQATFTSIGQTPFTL